MTHTPKPHANRHAPTDFGTSPELLFQPCDVNDDQCFIGGEGRTFKFDPLIRLPADALKDGDEPAATDDLNERQQQASSMAASL